MQHLEVEIKGNPDIPTLLLLWSSLGALFWQDHNCLFCLQCQGWSNNPCYSWKIRSWSPEFLRFIPTELRSDPKTLPRAFPHVYHCWNNIFSHYLLLFPSLQKMGALLERQILIWYSWANCYPLRRKNWHHWILNKCWKTDKEASKTVRAANSAKEALWCSQVQDEEFLL